MGNFRSLVHCTKINYTAKRFHWNCMCFNPLHLNPPISSNSCCSSILQKLVPKSLSCIWKGLWHSPIQRTSLHPWYKVYGQSGNTLPFLGISVHGVTRTPQSHLDGNQMQF